MFAVVKYFYSFRFNPAQQSQLNLLIKDVHQIKNVTPMKLSREETTYLQNIHELTNWNLNPELNKLQREIKFNNFKESMSFMNRIAILSQKINQYPQWRNLHNQVFVELNNDEFNGLSIKDFFLAYAIDQVALEIQFKSAESTDDIGQFDMMRIFQNWNQDYSGPRNYSDAQI